MGILGTLINISIWGRWIFCFFKALGRAKAYNNFLLISAFLLPFYSASFGLFGLQLSIYKLLPIALLGTYLLESTKISIKFIIIFVYFLSVTMICYYVALDSNLFAKAIVLGRSEDTTYIAPLIQAFFFLMVLAQLWLIRKNAYINHLKILAFYIYGCLFLVFIGYIQVATYVFGLPWFDFWFLNDALGRSAESTMANHAFDRGYHRMSSLAGEPRHFAAILALSLLLQQYLKCSGIRQPYINCNKAVVTSMFIFSGMLFSFSSSGILALVLGTTVYLLLTNRIKMVVGGCVFCVILFFSSQTMFIDNVLWKLTTVDMMLYAAPKDAFGLKALTHDWLHLMFGYGINLADIYVPDYYLIRETPFGTVNNYLKEAPMRSSIVPTSIFIQILVNGGLVGMSLMVIFFLMAIRRCRPKTKAIMISMLAMTTVSSTLIFSMIVFFFGIIISLETTSFKRIPS